MTTLVSASAILLSLQQKNLQYLSISPKTNVSEDEILYKDDKVCFTYEECTAFCSQNITAEFCKNISEYFAPPIAF